MEPETGEALRQVLFHMDYFIDAVDRATLIQEKRHPNEPDAWVFDARMEDVFDILLGTEKFLLPADNPPPASDKMAFREWSLGLVRQLDCALAMTTATGCGARDTMDWAEVQAVWLLAGSTGATTALQQFLNAFREPPPVAFIFAQHYDPLRQEQLDELTLENSAFSLKLADGRHSLRPGLVLMVPPRCKISFEPFGKVAVTRSGWDNRYTPDLNELFVMFVAAGLPNPGVILLSGMGDDGRAALEVLNAAACRIWAQDPAQAVCGSMPRSAINTGLVHKTAGPAVLAADLQYLYQS